MKQLNINPISRKRRNDLKLLLLISLGFLIVCIGCGKKGPPVPPGATIPPAVADLEAKVVKDKVRLTWSMPKQDDELVEGLTYFVVYKYKSPVAEAVCPECPIPFEHFHDIRLKYPEPAQVEGDTIIFYDTIEADHNYAYKVLSYHEDGGVSADSNIVRFVTEP